MVIGLLQHTLTTEGIVMWSTSFIERIYEGYLDRDAFQAFRVHRDVERIESVLDRFRELLKEYPPSLIEKEERVPAKMLKKMGEIGLFGLSIPAGYGGLNFNLWEYLSVVEEMASLDISVAIVSLAHLSIGVKGIVLFGNETQKQRYLPPAASGEMIFSYALTEPGIGSDAQHIETRAVLTEDGSHYVLNGQKTYITNANYAGGLTVFAQMDPKRPGFMGAFIVETRWDGVKIGKDMPKMGLKASSTAAVQFRDVRVPVENLIGSPGEGFKIAMSILNYGRLGLGAASAGMMNRSITDMQKRSSSRIQFGVPISSFDLIQEKIVKAGVHSLASSAMNDLTAYFLEQDPTANVPVESSHCKLFGTTRCWDVLYDALQVAGGSGYLSTQPYEKRTRDFRVATVFEGTTEIHSIYPPLLALRKISRYLSREHRGGLSRFGWLLGNLFRKTDWPLKFRNEVMDKASKQAKAHAVRIRRMILLGLLIHGKEAPRKQFLLRRITTQSVYLYGLLSILARMGAETRDRSPGEDELARLEYFLEEAKEAGNMSARLFDSRKEKLVARIFKAFPAP